MILEVNTQNGVAVSACVTVACEKHGRGHINCARYSNGYGFYCGCAHCRAKAFIPAQELLSVGRFQLTTNGTYMLVLHSDQ